MHENKWTNKEREHNNITEVIAKQQTENTNEEKKITYYSSNKRGRR
jgi:hypothetical protein